MVQYFMPIRIVPVTPLRCANTRRKGLKNREPGLSLIDQLISYRYYPDRHAIFGQSRAIICFKIAHALECIRVNKKAALSMSRFLLREQALRGQRKKSTLDHPSLMSRRTDIQSLLFQRNSFLFLGQAFRSSTERDFPRRDIARTSQFARNAD